jgi:quinolinate synthase
MTGYSDKERELMERIIKLKQEKTVFIIAHYYQREAIQDIADFVGDSYAMALAARDCRHPNILVAGVDFMAETAAILCPDKTILSPETRATCPMANRINIEDIQNFKRNNPDSLIVTYVNTPADAKAVSDVCCTSSNAEKIIRKLPLDKKIYFIPDRNLAINVAAKLDRPIEYFESHCPTHAKVSRAEIEEQRKRYPDARVLVHPECDPDVIAVADYVGSTAGILDYAVKSSARSFIIATECGILYPIRKKCPDKNLILASEELICPNMKSITLEKILYSIENMQTVITVPEEVRIKAVAALEKMIELAS